MFFYKFIIIGLLCLLSYEKALASPPYYQEGKATQDKIDYCQKLVKRFGTRSQRINNDYYGIGVQRPILNNWSIRIKEPSWFSSDLYLIFEQTTAEKYEDFTHRLVCHWDKHSFFKFTISHHTYSPVIICSWSAYITDEYDCP